MIDDQEKKEEENEKQFKGNGKDQVVRVDTFVQPKPPSRVQTTREKKKDEKIEQKKDLIFCSKLHNTNDLVPN